MKVKVIASVLAGVMVVQNVAMATSRVDAVGATQIVQGQNEVEVLKATLAKVESNLEDARTQVEIALNEKQGGMHFAMNVIHVGGAVLGLGLGAFSVYLATDPRGKGVAQMLMVTLGAGLTTVSGLAGLVDDATTKKPSVEEARQQLRATAQQLSDLIDNTKDRALRNELMVLEGQLGMLSLSVKDFGQTETNKKRVKIGAEISQIVGTALAIASLSNPNGMRNSTRESIILASSVAQSVGNLMSLMYLSSESDYQLILEKIDNNLLLVRNTLGSLN